ncbi:MAG: hypothetical protein J6S53_08250 [Lentisphaeria bacterium]|nr:hypothetical protein [Lentisphaeria bacterium]MBO7328707.1 hypothetical protein [Lentisphaeria bacterium]
MLTFLCGIVLAAVIYTVVVMSAGLSIVWGIVFAVAGLICVNVAVALILKAVTGRINNKIQQIMLDTRHRMEVQQNQFMRRPGGNQKQMMSAFERLQNQGLRQALDACGEFDKLNKWSPLLSKQTNAMRAMFSFQLKDYEMTDAYLEKALLMDPQTISIKLVRMYKKHASFEEMAKFYRKKCRSIKGENCILPVALYSWILMKMDKKEEAFKVLSEAKKKTDNEVIVSNWEALANDKVKSFSNAGLGELWYAMGLEEMKMPKVRQQYQYRR